MIWVIKPQSTCEELIISSTACSRKIQNDYILSSKLMKDRMLRKHISSITEYKILLVKTYLVLQ